jgi:hypothetical protein
MIQNFCLEKLQQTWGENEVRLLPTLGQLAQFTPSPALSLGILPYALPLSHPTYEMEMPRHLQRGCPASDYGAVNPACVGGINRKPKSQTKNLTS